MHGGSRRTKYVALSRPALKALDQERVAHLSDLVALAYDLELPDDEGQADLLDSRGHGVVARLQEVDGVVESEGAADGRGAEVLELGDAVEVGGGPEGDGAEGGEGGDGVGVKELEKVEEVGVGSGGNEDLALGALPEKEKKKRRKTKKNERMEGRKEERKKQEKNPS